MWHEKILFMDGEALVIDKPAGLAVTPGKANQESLDDYLDDLRFGFQRRPMPVHRLDRDTSGCLLLARNPKALKRFSAAFEARQVTKSYLAVLDGVPEDEGGVIDLALSKRSTREEGWRMVVDPKGKAARTSWQRLEVRDGRALVLLKPDTGRTHQLRVHAVEGIGLPISGDPVYGNGRGPMLLHALELVVMREGKPPIEARAPYPPTFVQLGFVDEAV